jgi:hypothetical protein
MDTDPDLSTDEPVIDASELVIEEHAVDDDAYDEIIVLDLRRPESHDLWLN